MRGPVEDPAAWLWFRVGGGNFAIPLAAVAEVTAATTPSLIPLVPRSVGGILNLRGEPLPALVGGALFGTGDLSLGDFLLVLEHEQRRVGVLVSEVRGIEGVRRSAPPEDAPAGPPFVEWIVCNRETLGLIEPEGLFDAVTALLLASVARDTLGEGSCQHEF